MTNNIRIVPIDEERTASNALYHCDACIGVSQWPRWRIEAGLGHSGNTRTMRLCDPHRKELLIILVSHDEKLRQPKERRNIT